MDDIMLRDLSMGRISNAINWLKNGFYTDDTLEKALTICAEGGFAEAAEYILSISADPDLQAPLMTAVGNGHMNMVRTLIDHGASVSLTDEKYPLSVALLKRRYDIARVLMKWTPRNMFSDILDEVAEIGDREELSFLLRNHTFTDIELKEGMRAAVEEGNANVVPIFIQEMGYIEPDNILVAAKEGHHAVLNILLIHGDFSPDFLSDALIEAVDEMDTIIDLDDETLSRYISTIGSLLCRKKIPHHMLVNAAERIHHPVIKYMISKFL